MPSPSYLLRRHRVLGMLAGLPAGRLLEIGCGAGALLYDLGRRGFEVSALEPSAEARQLALYINRETTGLPVFGFPQAHWHASFDYLLSCEVLEHIEDDEAALRQWHGWLKPGGHLVLSVPAHCSRWSASDEWAGHCRRYERLGLLDLVRDCGFSPKAVECYGFPLANLIEPLRGMYHGRRLCGGTARDRADCSLRSGIERSLETRLYPLQTSLPGTLCMKFFFAMQKLFLRTSLGTGFIALCTRR